jgi:lactose/L-arabinose transport system substrate-binding protein
MGITRRGFLSGSALAAAGVLTGARGRVAAAPRAAQSGTLTVWGWPGTFEGVQSQVQAFNQKYPNVTVNIQNFGHDDVQTNLLNSIVAGTGAPDLCAIDVLVLTQYIDGLADFSAHRAEFEKQFVPPILDLGSYQGKLYGLATDSEPMGVLYRKDIWDKYGITEDSIQTWADLAEAGDKVFKDSRGDVYLYAQASTESRLFEIMAVEQGFGGYFFDDADAKVIVDDPKCIEAAKALKQLWDSQGNRHDPNGGSSGDEMTVLLKSGKVASQIVGPGWYPFYLTQQMPELSGKWRLMRAPAIAAGGARVGYQYPTIFVIPAQSQQQDLAWELQVMGLTGNGARALWDQAHILPAFAPLFDELKPQPDTYFGGQKTFELWDAIARDAPKIFFGKGFVEAQTILGAHQQQILNGQTSPEDGMHAAAEEMRSKLQKG